VCVNYSYSHQHFLFPSARNNFSSDVRSQKFNSHSGKADDAGLLGCSTVTGQWFLKFRTNIVPTSSSVQQSNCRYFSLKHDIIVGLILKIALVLSIL
jgi:hypothetical protein